ncbi:MFS transporter [Thiomicrospira microaerophila]|uniref:MFS transporter n=1 Tax=Thiomicrospira microaerophila TaxID=406020 RepID=UPI000A917ECC|nr:MFS transporter [Thiomicrospira microaerophila]
MRQPDNLSSSTKSVTPSGFPRRRLASYYFVYFTLFGSLLPFFGLYMQGLGFSAWQIGQVMAALIGTKILAPYLWGWLADRTGRIMPWVRGVIGMATLASMGLLWVDSFAGVMTVVILFSFFWHGGLPLFEAYTFSQLGPNKAQYGKIRLWGSLGFIAAVLVLGELFSRYGLAGFPWVILGLFGVLWLVSWSLKDQSISQAAPLAAEHLGKVLKSPVVWSLLLVSFLLQFSHGTYYNFFSIDLTAHGYSKQSIAWLWSWGVLAEIVVFLAMVWLFRHYSVRNLILASLVLTLLRWQINIWGVDSIGWMLLAQTLHAASFGLFHAAALHLIDDLFKGALRGRGQAIYAATSQGLGGAAGALLAGLTWTLGGALLSYMVSSLAVLLAIIVAWRWLRLEKRCAR